MARLSRRTLALLLVVVLVAGAVATTVGVVLARDGDESPKMPGRIAVVDGCGLLHMWQDGTDQRRLCLPDIWAAVSLSFDGKTLAWDSVSGGNSSIVVGDADGRNSRPVPMSAGANFEPSLAPDGDSLAFLHSPRDDGRYNVWAGSTSELDAEQVTTSRNVSAVAWSPAGDWLAYVRGWSPDTLEGDIVVVRPDGDDERRLARGDGPAWAPDGTRLAFVRGGNVWTVGVDGSPPRLLVRNGHSPAWSRDGELVAFMREIRPDGGEERAFLVPARGGPARAVGPSFGDSRRLLWLPDPNE